MITTKREKGKGRDRIRVFFLMEKRQRVKRGVGGKVRKRAIDA